MELTNKTIIGDKRMEIVALSHKGRELQWQPVERTKRDEGGNVFEQINGYWKYRAEQSPDWEDQVFEAYCQIYGVMNQGGTPDILMLNLMDPVARLLDLHDLQSIRYWIDVKSDLLIPQGVSDTYNENDSTRWSRDKTYTTEDYRQLITMAIAVRAVLPVWGEFIFLTKREFDAKWKEYYAFQLIGRSALMESVAMTRLLTYIRAMSPDEEDMNSAILEGISSDEFPYVILSTLIIRRVAFMDIRGLPDKPNAISYLSQYLQRRTRGGNSIFGEVRPKRDVESGGAAEENKLSWFEDYKIKQQLTTGDVMNFEYEFQYPRRIVDAICPDLFDGFLQESLNHVFSLENQQIHKSQLVLVQWVLSRYIPPRSLLLLEKRSVLCALAVTQAILWHWGFYDLAALVTAQELQGRYETRPIFAGTVPKISKEMMEELDRLYPYSKPITRKSQKEINPAVNSINLLGDLFKEKDWVLTLPSPWLSQIGRNELDRKFNLPLDLKVTLTKLIIKLKSLQGATQS